MDRIWRIVQDDVPQLKRAVTALLALAEGRTSNGNEKEGHP